MIRRRLQSYVITPLTVPAISVVISILPLCHELTIHTNTIRKIHIIRGDLLGHFLQVIRIFHGHVI